jgi:hypothetical protein
MGWDWVIIRHIEAHWGITAWHTGEGTHTVCMQTIQYDIQGTHCLYAYMSVCIHTVWHTGDTYYLFAYIQCDIQRTHTICMHAYRISPARQHTWSMYPLCVLGGVCHTHLQGHTSHHILDILDILDVWPTDTFCTFVAHSPRVGWAGACRGRILSSRARFRV